tara:strand:+ start:1549 stop:2004 length:456 start_codon:yes stop_codon:yes gene_type:complete
MNEIAFRVNGLPGAQGSKKLSRWGAMIEASPRVHPWRQDVKFAAQNAYKGTPLEGAVAVAIEFIFPRPKSHFGTGKNADTLKKSAPLHLTNKTMGDIDKLARSTLDALSKTSGGKILEDDSQVVSLSADKRYAISKHDTPGAYISVIPLSY